MTEPRSNSSRISILRRIAWIGFGAVLIGLLVTAARLQPSPSGFGTHQQLGLPPCTIQSVFGIRCPACGMTTAWSHFTRGRVLAALQANAGGALLAALALVLGPWLVLSGIRGKWVWRPLTEWTAAVVCITVVLVTLVDWGCRLLANWR